MDTVMPRAAHYGDKPARVVTSGKPARRKRNLVSDAELDAYAKQVVDALPTLTEAQLDMLAFIFREPKLGK